jgi:hypothetical protein
VLYIDQKLIPSIDQNMCGVLCPCKESMVEPWMAMPNEQLNSWQRTKNKPNTLVDSLSARGNYYFITKPDSDPTTVASYEECVRKVIDDTKTLQVEEIPDVNDSKSNDHPHMTGLSIMKYYEEKHRCSGVCAVPHFFSTLSTAEGIPTETCLPYIKADISSNVWWFGFVVVFIGLMMFVSWVLFFCFGKDSTSYYRFQ